MPRDPTLVLGLGNELLRDDGVGLLAARRVAELMGPRAVLEEACVATIDLLPVLRGRRRVVVVDAYVSELDPPGTAVHAALETGAGAEELAAICRHEGLDEAAADRLTGIAVRTPLFRNDELDRIAGGPVLIKPENLQVVGSFKIRGAYNLMSRLPAESGARGVVAFSSGNHAQGVAMAGRLLGMPAAIVMPEDAPRAKILPSLTCGSKGGESHSSSGSGGWTS